MSHRRERNRYRSLLSNSTYNDDNDNDDNVIDSPVSGYSRLRHFVSKNQFMIHSLQYLSAASILLIPSTYQYYEAAAETCHALSNLISYINSTILSNNSQRYSRIEYILRQITRFIAQIEVLTDRITSICYDEAGRSLAIVVIESIKALCRLLILVNRTNISMLLHWGKDDNNGQSVTIDLENYINWYKLAALSYRSRSSQQSHHQQFQRQEGPIINNELQYVNVNNVNTTSSLKSSNYIGKRSGITMSCQLDFQLPQALPVETPATAIPLSNSNSPNDDDTRNRKYFFTAEQAFALGELLYVLRPVIYAIMYHQATVKINNNNNDNDDDDDDDDDDDADNNNGSNRNVNRKKITHTFAHVLALSVSLVVEVTSIQLSSLALRMSRDSAYLRAGCEIPSRRRNLLELRSSHPFDKELSRRRRALAFYILRSPFFDRATLPFLKKSIQVLHHIPIINGLPQYALNILSYLNDCHFYNSASS